MGSRALFYRTSSLLKNRVFPGEDERWPGYGGNKQRFGEGCLHGGFRLLKRKKQSLRPENVPSDAICHTARVADQKKDDRDELHALHAVVVVNRQDRVDERDALNARVEGWQNVQQLLFRQFLANALLTVRRLLRTHCDREEVYNLSNGAKVKQAAACSI
eukprot:6212662-Pleurochrysis_carterae.AAC.3